MTSRREFIGMFGGSAFVTTGWMSQTSSDTFDGGDGSSTNPYQISSIEQLQEVTDLSANYILTDNIDASDINDLTPIGRFSGTFNGDYYEIANLEIINDSSSVGLFEYVSGRIENLVLSNAYIENTSNTLSGTGGIAGTVNPGGVISQCAFSGVIQANSMAGGIAGECSGEITESYTDGQINSDDGAYFGGIVGAIWTGGVSDVYSLMDGGEGGIAGTVSSQLQRAFSACESIGEGICVNATDLSNTYWDTDVNQATGGSLSSFPDNVTALSTNEMSGEVAADNMPEFDFDSTWDTTSSYPALAWETNTDSNTAPNPSFSISPAEPQIGEEVTFDASGSSDDSGIDTYEWDLNDDGTFEASGQTTTTSFDSPGDYTITLRVTDTDGVSSTAEQTLTVSQTAFQQIKESHLETAQTVDDATIDTVQQGVSGIGVTSEAQAANDAYTEAVENGDISEDTAVNALRRLDRGIGLTGTVAKRIGPQPEGVNDTNDVDLTQSMAAPTIRTVVNLAAGISSMGKAADSADDIGLIKGEIIETAKEQVINGINSVIKYVLGESSDIAGTVKTEGNKIAEDLLNNGFETAAEVNDVIDTVTSRIVESASVALQTYVEQGNALGTPEVPQLTGTVFEDSPLTLDGGATLMYEALSADRVSSNGLVGSTTTAASAASTARQNIKDVADSAQSNIEAISGVADEFNIGESLVSLIQDPDIFSGIKTVISVITALLGSFMDALATGAGIGGLIEINIRHHVGLYSIIQGETV